MPKAKAKDAKGSCVRKKVQGKASGPCPDKCRINESNTRCIQVK